MIGVSTFSSVPYLTDHDAHERRVFRGLPLTVYGARMLRVRESACRALVAKACDASVVI